MAALFIPPLAFSIVSEVTDAGSAAINLNRDMPGLVWKSSIGTACRFVIDLGPNPVAYDTWALVGTNLRSSDTVQVRTGTTTSGTDGAITGGAMPAWTGNKPSTFSSTYFRRLPSVRTDRYIRVDVVASGHPDGYVMAQRFVVGKAIATGGISYNCEFGFDDRSVVTSGPGYTSVDEYDVIPTIKFSTKWITDASLYAEWVPMLHQYSSRRAIYFVSNDASANMQIDSLFGRMTSPVAAVSQGTDAWIMEAKIVALAA